ncbi:MAG: hypothetical protein M0D54_15800 [Hyphomonadaceae bacterium JAD_PAG50586_4]|nr:MAG: hypothetical protein M0D54_15800 [Hyphomonadaceae bacterium JAD_PAG50586_4]
MRARRRPPLPPTNVALADERTPLHENVAVYEVLNVPEVRWFEDWHAASAIGAFDGTLRRHPAVRGMMRQNFNRFLFALEDSDLLRIREAVACADRNPNG